MACQLLTPAFSICVDDGAGEIPQWLIKWASLTLQYIETEFAALPQALMQTHDHLVDNEEGGPQPLLNPRGGGVCCPRGARLPPLLWRPLGP